uniref:Glycosyl transferase family 2 n=1 Tax=Caulobacter sp. (strain K31) TaxID=366602 RepID=B0T448_CAUSK
MPSAPPKATPSVSVVIAAWNAADFIAVAVESAFQQEGVALEVIVVDDASSDDTAGAVQILARPGLVYHRQERNGGPAAARNAGFALATSDWVAVLDADDRFDGQRLAKLIAAAEAAGADIAADNFWITSEQDPSTRRLFIDEPLDDGHEIVGLESYALGNRLFMSRHPYGYLKPVFRRETMTRLGLRYDPRLRIGEDYQLVLEALADGARFLRNRSAGYIYVTRSGSISHRLRPEDVAAMIEADEAFLRARDGKLADRDRRAVEAHLSALKDGAAFIALIEALKRRNPLQAVKTAATRPGCLRHLAMPLAARAARVRAKLGLGAPASAETRALGA